MKTRQAKINLLALACRITAKRESKSGLKKDKTAAIIERRKIDVYV